MAGRKTDRSEGDPPLSDALAASLEQARERVEKRKGARAASDALIDETTRRPFSTRLTAREVHRLRVVAMVEGEGATELARRLILEGLLRLEAKHLADPRRAQLVDVVEQLHAQVDATKAVIGMLTGGALLAGADPAAPAEPRAKPRVRRLRKAT